MFINTYQLFPKCWLKMKEMGTIVVSSNHCYYHHFNLHQNIIIAVLVKVLLTFVRSFFEAFVWSYQDCGILLFWYTNYFWESLFLIFFLYLIIFYLLLVFERCCSDFFLRDFLCFALLLPEIWWICGIYFWFSHFLWFKCLSVYFLCILILEMSFAY